jgi:hypothetical protein
MNNSVYAIGIPLLLSLISNNKGSANQAELINIINNSTEVNKYKNLVAKNILDIYNERRDRSNIINLIYDNVVGVGFFHINHKKGLLNYGKKERPFQLAWRDEPTLHKDKTWNGLVTINGNKKEKYDYKMYISILHDLDPSKESMKDLRKSIGLIGKNALQPYMEKYPNNYFSAKMVGDSTTFLDHYDSFVIYSDSPQIIEEVYNTFISVRPSINSQLNHTYILSPEERKNVFMRGTLGIDLNAPHKDDAHSDSWILAQFIIKFLDSIKQKRKTPTKEDVIAIINTWADLPFQKKINFVEKALGK